MEYNTISSEPCNIIDHVISGHHETNFSVPFPWKLHEMLESAEKYEFAAVVSWLPNEMSFRVHSSDDFVSAILPKFFKQTKYKSFQRQLNMWGFSRIISGPGKGGYTHKNFIRGQPSLCRYMRRQKIKGNSTGQEKQLLNKQENSLEDIFPEVCASRATPSSFSTTSNSCTPISKKGHKNRLDDDLFDDETLRQVLGVAFVGTCSDVEG